MGDMWILSDYLNVLLSTHDEKIFKSIKFDVEFIYLNVEWWEYNQNNYINIIIINFSYSIRRFYNTILLEDCTIKFKMLQSRGSHIPLCFVTTCDNGVFWGGGGIYAPLNKFSRPICRYKATLTYFLALHIYL